MADTAEKVTHSPCSQCGTFWETSRAKGGFPDEQSAVNAALGVVAGGEPSWEDLRADGGLPEAR